MLSARCRCLSPAVSCRAPALPTGKMTTRVEKPFAGMLLTEPCPPDHDNFSERPDRHRVPWQSEPGQRAPTCLIDDVGGAAGWFVS